MTNDGDERPEPLASTNGGAGPPQTASGYDVFIDRPKEPPPQKDGTSRKRRKPRANAAPWFTDCQVSKDGMPIPDLANAMIALRRDPTLSEAFGYDQLFCGPMLLHPLPESSPKLGAHPSPVTDIDVSIVQEHLQNSGLRRLSKEITHQAIDQRAAGRTFHPVREYLNNVESALDGKRRLTNWLHDYLGADAAPYTSQIGEMFLFLWWPASFSLAVRPTT